MPAARSGDGGGHKPNHQLPSRAGRHRLAFMQPSVSPCYACNAQTISFIWGYLGTLCKGTEVPIEHDCNLNPCSAKQRAFNPVCIDIRTIVLVKKRSNRERERERESDAILAAQMLQSAVARELQGRSCPCNFCCDSDIGCRHCIRQGLKAVLGHMPSKQRNASAEIAWIADTGSAQDLVCSRMISNDLVYHSNEPLELMTANGSQSADQPASIHIDCINKEVQPYVLPDTPAVISVLE